MKKVRHRGMSAPPTKLPVRARYCRCILLCSSGLSLNWMSPAWTQDELSWLAVVLAPSV